MIVKTETDLRREIVEIGRRVYDRFFVAANDGNISARVEGEAMLVTPTGVSKGIYDYRGHPEGEPGGEGVGGQRGAPAYLGDAAAPGNLPRAGRRGSGMAPFLAGHDVFLLGNHGVVTLGRTLEEVYFQMERLELFARIRLAAMALGPASVLPPEEVAKLVALRERLRTVPGIAYFAPAYGAPKDVEAIKAAVVEKLAGFVVSDCPEPFAPLRAGRSRRAQDRLTSKAEMGQSRDPPAT